MVTNHILGYLNQKWLSVESPEFPVVEDQKLCMYLDISDLVDTPLITSVENDC